MLSELFPSVIGNIDIVVGIISPLVGLLLMFAIAVVLRKKRDKQGREWKQDVYFTFVIGLILSISSLFLGLYIKSQKKHSCVEEILTLTPIEARGDFKKIIDAYQEISKKDVHPLVQALLKTALHEQSLFYGDISKCKFSFAMEYEPFDFNRYLILMDNMESSWDVVSTMSAMAKISPEQLEKITKKSELAINNKKKIRRLFFYDSMSGMSPKQQSLLNEFSKCSDEIKISKVTGDEQIHLLIIDGQVGCECTKIYNNKFYLDVYYEKSDVDKLIRKFDDELWEYANIWK